MEAADDPELDALPDDLRTVVERCLAASPKARFPNARALYEALAGCPRGDALGLPPRL